MRFLPTRPLHAFALGTLSLALLTACGGGGDAGTTTSDTETPLVWGPPGGNATVTFNANTPFRQFAPSIDASLLVGLNQGRELFTAPWDAAPGPRPLLDGLGPLFNANACTACHADGSRVPPLNADGSTTRAVLLRLGNTAGDTHPVYGGQLQSSATSGNPEGLVSWLYDAGTRLVNYSISFFDAPGLDGYAFGPRISPQLVGTGLLDLVPESTIQAGADPSDANGDGISGRVHWVVEEGVTRVGRFGWKAINASLRTQNAGAMNQDMGLTSPVHPDEPCTSSQAVCAAQPNGGTPEVSEASLTAVVDFMTALGVPDRRVTDQTSFDRGARLFDSTGCVACHTPTLTTGTSTRFPSLSNQTLYAYTDLLLHDMGESLSDGVKEKDAAPAEWRTPPLWSLGLVEQRSGARFLHDGRAATIREAIEWHGGEAQNARNRYGALSSQDQDTLLLFLRGI